MPTATAMARAGQLTSDADPTFHTHEPHGSLGTAECLATGFALVLCIVARLPHHVTDALGIRGWELALVVVVTIVSGARAFARAPFSLVRALHGNTDRAVALREWGRKEFTTVIVTIVAGTAFTVPLYALLRSTPAWWLPAWLLFAGITLGWQLAMPLAIKAQAGPLTPPPEALALRIEALAVKAGVDVPAGVAVAGKPGSRRCNAYVVGFGPARKVVLEQGVAAWPHELVDQAVAHELGHLKMRHSARRLPLTLLVQLGTLAAAAAVLSFEPLLRFAGVADAGDPRSYPLLLVAGAVIALPARCLLAWRDRAQERAADHFALTLLQQPQHFSAMLQRVSEESGTPRTLTWWRRLTATHPPVDERAVATLSFDLSPSGG
jgi:Zn-dependent protease with chaperone function